MQPARSGADDPPTRLPLVPAEVRWDDLHLSYRAHTRLTRLYQRPADLSGLPIAQLLHINGFGEKSVTDVIEAVAACTPPAPPAQPLPAAEMERAQRQTMRLARALQRSPLSAQLGSDDVRFGARIRSLSPEAKDAGEMADRLIAGAASGDPLQIRDGLKNLLRNLRAARKMCVEDELSQMLTSVRYQGHHPVKAQFLGYASRSSRPPADTTRNRQVTARILGWDGLGGCTLQMAGDEFGLTRERVRQICQAALDQLRGRAFVPIVDAALALGAQHTDQPAAAVEAHLQNRGLTKGLFRLEGILQAADVFERIPAFQIQTVGGCRFVTGHATDRLVKSVLRFARTTVRGAGPLTLSDLCARFSAETGQTISENGARRILETSLDFRWLDDAAGWFWFPALPLSAVPNRIRKVLSVAPRISVTELRAAIFRARRIKGFTAPAAVLLEMCRQLPWCRVDETHVESAIPLNPAEELWPVERALWQILLWHGGALSREKIKSLWRAQGRNERSISPLLTTSPLVRRYAPAFYCIAGLQPPPPAPRVPAQKPAPPRVRVAPLPRTPKPTLCLGFGRPDDRRIWIGFKLSAGMIHTGSFTFPPPLRGLLSGTFPLLDPDGARAGQFVVKQPKGWGLIPLFSRRGTAPGDCLVLLFDLTALNVTTHLGNEDLVVQYAGKPF